MADVPDVGGFDLYDDEEDFRTVVDTSFWNQPKIPDYAPLAHFGRFEILGRIARGGMAEVYLAREWDEAGKARHLVVKRVLPEMEDNPDLLRMFLDEGRVATRLYHQNVCHVYESGEIDGVAFMALEWVWGPALEHVVERAGARGGCIPWPVAVEIGAQMAAALHYVHHAKGVNGKPLNIVHRDVSPQNIMLQWNGTVKLLDFGIAKTSSDITTGGAAVGKYGYMSPEQAQSQRVDPRSDIFALGIVLYEALTGKALYDRPTLLDTLSAIVREPVPSLKAERPELPDQLESIAKRALAKDPAHRFQSAGEMKAALKQVLRANGQVVTDQRIALFLEGLFTDEDRQPLRESNRVLTGQFTPLSPEQASAALSQNVTYQTFDHSGGSIAPSGRPSAAPKQIPTPVLVLGLILIALVMGGLGIGLALLLMS